MNKLWFLFNCLWMIPVVVLNSLSCKAIDSSMMVDGGHDSISYPGVIMIKGGQMDDDKIHQVATCSASVLSDRTLLTAGHCMYIDWNRVSYVIADISGKNGSKPQALSYKVHPEYRHADRESSKYDIAVLSFPPGSFRKIVDTLNGLVLSSYLPQEEDRVRLVGYGRYTEKTGVLKTTKLEVADKAEQKRVGWNNLVGDSACVKGMLGVSRQDIKSSKELDKDPDAYYHATLEHGDSGGPLLKDNTKVVIGVASYRYEESSAFFVGGQTVSCYASVNLKENLEFIKTTVEKEDVWLYNRLKKVTPLSLTQADFVQKKK